MLAWEQGAERVRGGGMVERLSRFLRRSWCQFSHPHTVLMRSDRGVWQCGKCWEKWEPEWSQTPEKGERIC
jgi:ribosomal protein L37AE/L43A